MAKTDGLDVSKPEGSSDRRQGDNHIRTLARAVVEMINVDHFMDAASPYTSDACGEHLKVTLRVGSAPTGATDKGMVAAVDKGGKAELHYINEDNNAVQMTSGLALGSQATPVLASTLNVAEVATFVKTAVLSSGASCGSKVLSAVANPVAAQDAATKAYADGTGLVQMVNVMKDTSVACNTIMPYDDTIPQNTEGDEVMTLAITPTNASNKLLIEVVANVEMVTGNRSFCVALFKDAVAAAIAAVADHSFMTTQQPVVFKHYMTAGTTDEITFKVRVGSATADNATFNNNLFGGVHASSITITEIKA